MLSQARSHLLCGELRDRAGMLRHAAALTSQDIATAMTGLRRQMIMVTPQALPAVRARMPPLRATPAAAVTGTRYTARRAQVSLTIGADGVSLQGESDLQATVRFDDLAALLRWNDGTQMLVGNDGFRIRLAAADWSGADQALSDLPGLVTAAQIVTIDAAGPPGHQVSTPPPEPVRPATAQLRSRWQPARTRAVFWLLLAIWLLLASMALADKLISPPLFVVLIVVTLGVSRSAGTGPDGPGVRLLKGCAGREALVTIGPGECGAAGAMGRGRLRASDADREQVIDTLKAAFVQGWLTRDQFGVRAGQALVSRTYAELAAVTDGIPARVIGVVGPPPLPAGRARKPAGKKVAAQAAWVIIPAALGAAFFTYYGGFFVLFLLAFTGLTVTSKR
jgi:hypothetical protein